MYLIKKNLRLFYSSVFFQHLAYGAIIPTLIIWQHKNGLTFSQIAIIQSIGLLVLSIMEIPSSYFADKIGKKITLVMGLVLTIFAFLFLISADSFLYFLLFQICFSGGLALLSGTEEAFLHDITHSDGKQLTHYLGSMSIADEIGTIVGMLISSIVIKYFSITISFQISFWALILSLIFIIFVPRIFKETSEEQVLSTINILSFLKISIIAILIIVSLAFLSERGEMIYQNSFNNLGLNLGSFGLIYIVAKMFSVLGSKMSYFLEKSVKQETLITLIGVFQIFAFLLLIIPFKIVAIISLCIFFFFENVFRNIKSSFILKNSPSSRKATNLSLVSFSTSIIFIFTKLTLGWSLDINFIYAIIIIVLLKAIAIIFFLKKRKVLIVNH